MSNSPVTLTFAEPPFNNSAADVIIRSRDGVHFCVRSAILAEASPVLSDMLASPQCERTIDGKSVLALQEESDVLDPLLRLCYPVADPVFASLKEIRLVLAVALKYNLEEASLILRKKLRSYIDNEPLLSDNG